MGEKENGKEEGRKGRLKKARREGRGEGGTDRVDAWEVGRQALSQGKRKGWR